MKKWHSDLEGIILVSLLLSLLQQNIGDSCIKHFNLFTMGCKWVGNYFPRVTFSQNYRFTGDVTRSLGLRFVGEGKDIVNIVIIALTWKSLIRRRGWTRINYVLKLFYYLRACCLLWRIMAHVIQFVPLFNLLLFIVCLEIGCGLWMFKIIQSK